MSTNYRKIHISKSRIIMKQKMNLQVGTSKNSIISKLPINKAIKIYYFSRKAITRKKSSIEKCWASQIKRCRNCQQLLTDINLFHKE